MLYFHQSDFYLEEIFSLTQLLFIQYSFELMISNETLALHMNI